MLCGLGVPLLRSLWGAVRNRQLYTLLMCWKICISFNFQFSFIIYTTYRKKITRIYCTKNYTTRRFFCTRLTFFMGLRTSLSGPWPFLSRGHEALRPTSQALNEMPRWLSIKWAVTSTVSLVLLLRRDLVVVDMGAGALLSGLLSKALKVLINRSRPTAVAADPGMPSSHATNLFFMATFIASHVTLGLQSFDRVAVLVTLAALLTALGLSYLRIASGHHTAPQILAGAALGTGFGVFWCSAASPVLTAGLMTRVSSMDEGLWLGLRLLLVTVAFLILGPLERVWKGRFRKLQSAQVR